MLTAIIGNIQLVLESIPPDSPDYPLLSEIEKAATRATSLTRQLLTFSRRQPIERRTIDLNGAINELSQMLRRLLARMSMSPFAWRRSWRRFWPTRPRSSRW